MRTFGRLFVVSATAVVIAACGGGGPAATSSASQRPSVGPASQAPQSEAPVDLPTPATALTACELVTPADIEAATNLDAGTVGEGELKETPNVLDPESNECRYTGDWGGLVVAVTPIDGVNVFDAVNDTFGDEAEDLGLGDGALWFEDDKRGYFLKGSVMVRLQFTHLTSGEFDSFRDPTVAVGEAALGRI